jgi:hypothetical protein
MKPSLSEDEARLVLGALQWFTERFSERVGALLAAISLWFGEGPFEAAHLKQQCGISC